MPCIAVWWLICVIRSSHAKTFRVEGQKMNFCICYDQIMLSMQIKTCDGLDHFFQIVLPPLMGHIT